MVSPQDRPAALVHARTEALLGHPAWTPTHHEPEPLHPQQVSLQAAITRWALFQLHLVPAVAHFLLGWGRGLVERFATATTLGREADAEARLRPLPSERVAELADARMRGVQERLRTTLLEEEEQGDQEASWCQAVPTAWHELRDVALALVDGSRLPVVHPGLVVGHPDDVYEVESGARIGLVDVEVAAQTVADIEEYRRTVRDDPARRSGRHAATSRRARAGDEVAAHDDPFAPFLSWLEQRERTLMWQVAARVDDLRQQARARAARAERAIAAAAPPATDRLEAARQLLVACWGVALAAALLFTVMSVLSVVDDPGGVFSSVPDVGWYDLARVALVAVTVLLTAGTLHFHAMHSYARAVACRIHTLQRAADECVAARHEERRWQHVQAELADWAVVLGELLHRPWAPPRSSSTSPRVGSPTS